MSLWGQIYKDYRRYRATDESWLVALLAQGFWASTVYRVFRHAHDHFHVPGLRKWVLVLGTFVGKFIEITTGISIPVKCDIGEGLYIGHFGTIFFLAVGRLGHNCSLSQGVTLGIAGRGENRGAPTLGDRVYVGPHAIVVGKITVGDDAVIAAGAVVTRSIPPRAVVLGNPARVISSEGSFDYVRYDGMEADPARIASLNAAQGLGEKPPASRNGDGGPRAGAVAAPPEAMSESPC